jgi:predicted permease
MLTETLLLITLGSVAGVILGYSAVDASGSMLHSATTTSSQLGYRVDYSFDWRVLAYTLAIATFTLLCVGLWPAFHANRHELNAVLHGGGHGSSPRRRFGIRSVLVVTQVAGSLMLLIVAGLFVRSLARAEHMFMGFDPDQVLTIMLTPKQIGYDEVRTRAFFRDIQATLRGTAGVESASSSYTVPMGMPSPASPIFVEGHPFAKDQRAPVISFNSVDPDYFTTLRIPIVQGRAFNVSDNEAAPRVAIVNQTMARKLWPNEDAIGKRFRRESESGELLTVVGVAHDGQYFFLSPDPQRYFYLPIAQNYSAFRYLEIRSPLPPESLLSSVQEEIRKLAPDLPIIDARTMQDTVHGLAGLFVFRLAASLAAVMGVLGLVLAVVGVYGVVSYNAAQRTHEIGVRVALGAERRDIMKLVLEQGLRLVVAGLLVGLLAAAVLTRGMTKLLIGVGATDPMTYAAVATLLSTVALLACWLPAFKATRVNPVVALRQE